MDRFWSWPGRASAIIFSACLLASSGDARASNEGQIILDIFNIIAGAAQRQSQKEAYEEWSRLEGSVIGCLRQMGVEPNDLVQKGVGPSDKRVKPYVEKCKQLLEAERQRQVEENRRRVAVMDAERERVRQEAERQQQEQEQQRREEAARERAARETRIKDLESKFPKAWVPTIMDRRIESGWTKEAVRESWGSPDRTLRTPDGSEMWEYGRRRVIFVGGKVSFFEE